MIVPGADSEVRASFDMLCEQFDLRVNVTAAVDDMAMLRVFARSAPWAVVVPTVVVRDEIRTGTLEEYCARPNVYENFFAISIKRKFQHPLLKKLLTRRPEEVLGMP